MSAIPSPDQPWSLAGKTALVTGASRGIGRATAIHLARKGLSKIAITYVSNPAAAESTLDECRKLGVKEAICVKADILDPSIGPSLVRQVLDGLHTSVVDIIVNNAVLSDPATVEAILDTTLENFSKTMQANVFAAVSIISSFMPHLPPYGGRVINISSNAGKTAAHDPIITYAASKATLENITRSLAGRYAAEKGATFNSVVAGSTMTESVSGYLDKLPPESAQQFYNFAGLARTGVPDDIAYVVGFLASEEGRWVNGSCVSANGGSKLTLGAF